jgi:SAM-dependent methyltransferase
MPIDLDAYREQSLKSWGEMAPGWERRRSWLIDLTGSVNDWLVEAADPQPGQTYLDIAAGTGDLGFAIAKRVGEEGRVISSDFAPEMVEAARRGGESLGLTNVEYRVLNAERMDLDDDSVDGVVCRWGYMLMADPAAALKETRRLLRDGGPLAFVVWAGPDRNQWIALPAMTLVERGHMPPPEPGAPGILSMGDPDRIRDLVRQGGFADPEPQEITFQFRWPDAEDFWDQLVSMAGPLARAINALDEEEREATRTAIMEKVAQFRQDDGAFVAPAACWGVLVR